MTNWQFGHFCELSRDESSGLMDPAENCVRPVGPDEAPTYDETLSLWRSQAAAEGCNAIGSPYMTVGTCGGGAIRVLARSNGFSGDCTYFDASKGSYLGDAYWSDVALPPCCGNSYWPGVIECEDAVVTEVICGDAGVGDRMACP